MSAAEELLLGGFNARTAWKAPCLVASTSPITLAGEQTIDDVGVEFGDRVLVIGQAALEQNGLYTVSTGAWTRCKDFSDARSAQLGTTVVVSAGTSNSGVYRLTSPRTGEVRPGETELEFTKIGDFDSPPGTPPDGSITAAKLASNSVITSKIQDAAVTGAKIQDGVVTLDKLDQVLVRPGVTRWVRVATTANITLSGAQTIDGVSVIAGEHVLVKDQGTASQNGIYTCAAGAWTRRADFDSSAEITRGILIEVREGTTNGGKTFKHTTSGTITVGSTNLVFAEFGAGGGGGGTSISQAGGSVAVDGAGIITATSADGALFRLTDSAWLTYPAGDVLIGIDDAAGNDANSVLVNASSSIQLASAGTITATADDTITIAQNRPGSDVLAPGILIRPARATSFATATTANKVGGPLDIEAGEPRTSGTDQPGPINFYIGKGVSSSVDTGTIWHSGTRASVDYKLGHIRDQAGIWSLDGYRPTRVATLTPGHLLSLIGSGGINISDPNGYNIQAYSAGGIAAFGGGTINVYGLTVAQFGFGTTRQADWYYASSGTVFRRDFFFAPVTPAGAGATSIGSVAFPASSAGRFVGAVVARNGSSNSQSWDVTFDWNSDGTTVTLRNFVATATTPQGTINGTIAKGAESGLTCPIEVTSGTGERYNFSGIAWVNA